MHYDIVISTDENVTLIDAKLVDFNNSQVPVTQTIDFIPLNFHIKNDNDEIIGGINALMYCWGMVCVDILFVDKEHRFQKLGSQLLQKVETEAKKRGATLIHLDTFDFQAKDFYLKHGYEIFGVLESCPPGHQRYYLKKVLV